MESKDTPELLRHSLATISIFPGGIRGVLKRINTGIKPTREAGSA